MKKSLCLLPVILAVATLTGNSREPHALDVPENPPILIVPIPSEIPDAPRMPTYNPFFAELMDGYVMLGSSTDYGTVSVSLISTAGDYYFTSFDTTGGAILLPFSGEAGLYTLRITTSSGLRFAGEFTI